MPAPEANPVYSFALTGNISIYKLNSYWYSITIKNVDLENADILEQFKKLGEHLTQPHLMTYALMSIPSQKQGGPTQLDPVFSPAAVLYLPPFSIKRVTSGEILIWAYTKIIKDSKSIYHKIPTGRFNNVSFVFSNTPYVYNLCP